MGTEDCIAGIWAREASCLEDDYLPPPENAACLRSFSVTTLKYAHGEAFCYTKRRLQSTSGIPIMLTSMDGEVKL
jgi:hypothetical protein